ncbi:uncharacterized protein LOC113796550 [Dermatophagoides pteronyssinus]|uniref:uncharacterized protein LOC113796550 n=1 Tax=Dermatophagoides pteronyssinus TaxID=6956 RepID=UPI003F664976
MKLHSFSLIIYLLLLINLLIRSIYLIGQLFNALKYLLFFIELLKLQIKQIILHICSIIQLDRFDQSIYRQFMKQYDQLNHDVFIINQTMSRVFFGIETISKSAIIYCSIFYSKQTEMHLFNTIICIFLLSTFIFTNGIYSRASQLPYYNRLGCLSLMKWLARKQYQRYRKICGSKKQKLLRPLSICNEIRSNLFGQIMSENHLGFSCGQIFLVIKYKYVELFLMNFVLILLFYKKICMK